MTHDKGKTHDKSKASELMESESESSANFRAAVSSSNLFDRLRNGLKKVTVDGEEYYVAEGDTLLDEAQLGVYAMQREAVDAAREAAIRASEAGLGLTALIEVPTGLLGMTENGKIVRWAPDTVLSYRVIQDTFPKADDYRMVVENMRAATAAWEAICGVRFEHRQELDERPGTGNEGVLFTVRELNAGGMFIAAAFFPNDPVSRRRVVIDPSYYDPNLGFDKVGVLRHELGHVLGFRHEHIRNGAPPACPGQESLFDTQELTPYDPQSVMHYFCGDKGSRNLAITNLDIEGAQKVYGPPLSSFRLIEAV